MDGKRVEDFFTSGEEFESILEEAESQVSNKFHSDFCYDWRQKWDKYGMRGFMTEQAYQILRRIAGYAEDD